MFFIYFIFLVANPLITYLVICYLDLGPAGVAVKDAFGAKGLGFDSWTGQVECSVVNGSPPLRCFLGAALPRR